MTMTAPETKVGFTATEILDNAITVLRTTQWTCHEGYGEEGACILEAVAMGSGDEVGSWSDNPVKGTSRGDAVLALHSEIMDRTGDHELWARTHAIDTVWVWNDGNCTGPAEAIDALTKAKARLA